MSSQAFSKSSSASPGAYENDKEAESSLSLDVLKSLTDKRTARDGNPPKRRGPKPDSKPALTRRQELNRQAQRKELYIKALEDEVLRLKEVYSTVSQAQDQLAHENRLLREALKQHGIVYPAHSIMDDAVIQPSAAASVSGYSQSSGPPNPLTPGLTSQSTAPSIPSPNQSTERRPMTRFQPCSTTLAAQQAAQQAAGRAGLDSEQAGIDFVLTLEKPCMAHLPFLVDRAAEAGGEPCGHALMATCPPQPFDKLTPEIPFGHTQTVTEEASPRQQTWELSNGGLSVLLDLSKRLNLDGEITPVMAWGMVMGHERFSELQDTDLLKLAEELRRKVRCYGFGAVIEEFEVRDAMEGVLSVQA
ncbi:AP-1-like transcription factor 2 [Paramyrothecium foliicola]|nr:AP-1-like transcription factor 2 [Paramyrothecium foliicola]